MSDERVDRREQQKRSFAWALNYRGPRALVLDQLTILLTDTVPQIRRIDLTWSREDYKVHRIKSIQDIVRMTPFTVRSGARGSSPIMHRLVLVLVLPKNSFWINILVYLHHL